MEMSMNGGKESSQESIVVEIQDGRGLNKCSGTEDEKRIGRDDIQEIALVELQTKSGK